MLVKNVNHYDDEKNSPCLMRLCKRHIFIYKEVGSKFDLYTKYKSLGNKYSGGCHRTRAIDHAPRAMGGTVNIRTFTI